jgi:aldehyde:ferredoxin oxidoreductase
MLQPILKIDLSTGTISTYDVPREWVEQYVGGASLAARLLYDQLTPELDPLSEAAPLLILNGPLTGTAGPAVGRFVVCGKSPATGLWAESNVGGFWGPELRMAGYDGVWITGAAKEPIYIWIHDSTIEIRSAKHLWGQDTYQIQDAIKKELNVTGAHVLGIGPAGEARIPFALMLCDHGRVAGRTGMGAVMGSKNLKVVIVKGSQKISVFDPASFAPLRSEANRLLKKDPVTLIANDLGTASVADYFDYLGEMPKKYWTSGAMEGVDRVSGSTIAETILVGKSACHACVIACGRVVRLEDGEKRKGPEYETIVGFGPNLAILDTHAITRLGELCDRYGMDTISLSNTIGLVFRLVELHKITSADAGGLDLSWGNVQAVEQLIHLTVRREGLGQFIALGARGLARHFGAEEEAVHVNGLEPGYHDPRGGSGMALVYATSPRGACHNQSDYFLVDIGQAEAGVDMEFFDRHAGAEKAANVAKHQNWRTLNNSLVMCIFANVAPETQIHLINSCLGFNWTIADMLRAGERAWNLKRLINIRLGLTRAGERLPKVFSQPFADGGSAGYIIPFDEMLDAYYDARGWDKTTGAPLKEKLKALGLENL